MAHGLDTIYALPGVHNDDFFDALARNADEIRTVHTRHEQGAAYMALGAALGDGKAAGLLRRRGTGPAELGGGAAHRLRHECAGAGAVRPDSAGAIGRGFAYLHEIRDQAGITSRLVDWSARIDAPREAPQLIAKAFTTHQRRTGYRYRASVIQVEFALTQVVDRPVHGRVFFEEVLRENIDLGRPDNLQLIFARRVTKRTPGPFRTRIVREGVIPSLYVDYKTNRLKQYFKEGRALRTELTVNNAGEFGLGRSLDNLPALRELAFQATRRLLDVQKTSQDFAFSEQVFREVTGARCVGDQRASAFRFGEQLAQAIFGALLVLRLLPRGFRSADLREHLAPLLGVDPSQWTQGRLTYQLRRLRLHELIERAPASHRYTLTDKGLRVAMWFTRCHARLFRPALGELFATDFPKNSPLRRALGRFDQEVSQYIEKAKLRVAI